MKCPNECGYLTSATNKRCEFEDSDDNEIELRITVVWCPECLFVQHVYDDS